MIDLHDYLIDPGDFDWSSLLSGWSVLVPETFTVWLMNRFGDLFLVLPDGSVHMLDVGVGTLTELCGSRESFCAQIDDNASDWLMIPLVDELVAAGTLLGPKQCYSFKVPPVLGGEYATENVFALDIDKHFGVYGSIHSQLSDAEDGTDVVIEIGP